MLLATLLLLAAAQAPAGIEHSEIACVVAGQFPGIEARVASPGQVAKARTYFHADEDARWYSVEMKLADGVWRGVLPKPLPTIKRLHYYIEITDTRAGQNRTPDYAPMVVAQSGECPNKGLVAAAAVASKVAVVAPVGATAAPAGFAATSVVAAGGGISGTALAVTAVAVAGGAAAAAVVSKGGGDSRDDGPSGPSPSPSPNQNPFRLSGTVYSDPCCPPGPVDPALRANSRRIAGAVVSTSLDSATATTDAQGVFHLASETPCPREGETYTVRITAAGCDPLSFPRPWGCTPDSNVNAINLACR